jgi:thioredoxin
VGFAPVHVPSFVAMAASAFLVSPCTHLVGGKLANKGESRGRRGAVLTTTGSSREMVQCAVWQSRKGFIPGFPCSGFLGQQCLVRSVCSSRQTLKKRSLNSTLAKASLLVRKVTARELDDILGGERTQPMVVDFYATWCGPCILLAQELETLAVEYGDRVRFLKIDTDEEHELATQMEIRGLPTMVFVSKDTEKHAIRTEGLLPGQVIRDIIDKEL